jgi:hypothetical protein
MNRKEVLEETLQFYWEDPERRAVSGNGNCQYITDDGRKCAVGRLLSDEQCKELETFSSGKTVEFIELPDDLLERMALPYRLAAPFLTSLQCWHDCNTSFEVVYYAISNVVDVLNQCGDDVKDGDSFFIGTFE